MYKTKSKNIVAMAQKLCSDFGGEVPDDYDALISLPGVGRKTANVVLSVGFGQPRIAVDTHVFRVANRIGLVHEKDVLKTELALMEKDPRRTLVPYPPQLDFSWQTVLRRAQTEMRRLSDSHLLRIR